MSPALPLQLHHYTGVEDTALHLGFTVAVPAAAAVGGEVHDTGASSRCTGGCRRDGPGSIVSAQPPQRLPRQSVSLLPRRTCRTPRSHTAASSVASLSRRVLSLFLSVSLSLFLCFLVAVVLGLSSTLTLHPAPRQSPSVS